MKKVCLILVALIGFSLAANAQDIILKKDASDIKAKVFEITDQQIKYKDFDFQDGPMYIINISEVFMITYENGKREVFNNVAVTETPPAKESSEREGYALLHLYRPGTPYGSAIKYNVSLEGKGVWLCKNGRKKTIRITNEGIVTLQAKTEAESTATFNVEFGKEYYVECTVAPGVWAGRPSLVLKDENLGRTLFNKIAAKNDDTEK